jgi:hypothetical protein
MLRKRGCKEPEFRFLYHTSDNCKIGTFSIDLRILEKNEYECLYPDFINENNYMNLDLIDDYLLNKAHHNVLKLLEYISNVINSKYDLQRERYITFRYNVLIDCNNLYRFYFVILTEIIRCIYNKTTYENPYRSVFQLMADVMKDK